jgi:hypothetical protein
VTALTELKVSDVSGLSSRSSRKLRELGYDTLGDFAREDFSFHKLYEVIGFDQSKLLMKALIKAGGLARFSKPD